MPTPLGHDTITVLKPTITTDTVDNAQMIDFDSPTEVVVAGCSVQPFLPADKLQYENTSERDFARATWVVYAPHNAVTLAIAPRDRISFLGRVYEVYGEVGAWRRRSGQPHHVQIILMTREG